MSSTIGNMDLQHPIYLIGQEVFYFNISSNAIRVFNGIIESFEIGKITKEPLYLLKKNAPEEEQFLFIESQLFVDQYSAIEAAKKRYVEILEEEERMKEIS